MMLLVILILLESEWFLLEWSSGGPLIQSLVPHHAGFKVRWGGSKPSSPLRCWKSPSCSTTSWDNLVQHWTAFMEIIFSPISDWSFPYHSLWPLPLAFAPCPCTSGKCPSLSSYPPPLYTKEKQLDLSAFSFQGWTSPGDFVSPPFIMCSSTWAVTAALHTLLCLLMSFLYRKAKTGHSIPDTFTIAKKKRARLALTCWLYACSYSPVCSHHNADLCSACCAPGSSGSLWVEQFLSPWLHGCSVARSVPVPGARFCILIHWIS